LLISLSLFVLAVHAGLLLVWLKYAGVEPVIRRPDMRLEFLTPAPVSAQANAKRQPTTAPSKDKLATETAQNLPATLSAMAPVQVQAPVAVAASAAAQTSAQAAAPAAAGPAATPVAAPAAAQQSAPTPAAEPGMPATARNTDADYKAAYLNNPRPAYPLLAIRQGAQGQVLLLVEVLPDGRAGRIELEKFSGHAMLDAAAINAVRAWRFTPARKDGLLTTQTVRIPIHFNLKE
jgi:protein TonB